MTDINTLVANATASFPKAPATGIHINEPGTNPSPLLILRFQRYLNACATSIPGETELGMLGLVIDQATYESVNDNVAFQAPPVPGATPVIADGAVSAALLLQHQQALKTHDDAKTKHKRYKAAQTALRNLIVANVDNQFISSLRHNITQFHQVPPIALMDHLKNTYGQVAQEDLDDNEHRLREPWDHTTPIESLFDRMQECQDYAEAGDDPITEKTIMRQTYLHIKRTGLFNDACDTWDDKPSGHKTWINFRLFFIDVNSKIRKHTTGDTGHAMANAVTNNVTNIIEPYLATIEALRSEVEQMKATTQHAAPINNAAITTETLRSILAEINPNICNNNTSAAPAPGTIATPTANNIKANPPADTNDRDPRIQGYTPNGLPLSYCHTCGITTNLRHSSKNCRNKGPNHNPNATLMNKMGGNEEKVKPRPRPHQPSKN